MRSLLPHAVSGNTFKVNLAFGLGQRPLLWLLRRTNLKVHLKSKSMVIENNRFCVLPCAALNCTQNQMYTASLCAEQPVLAGVWVSAGSHRAPLPKLHTHQHRPAGAGSTAPTSVWCQVWANKPGQHSSQEVCLQFPLCPHTQFDPKADRCLLSLEPPSLREQE